MTPDKLIYFRITDLWKNFCEQHNALFDLTLEEYQFLLESRVDDIPEILEKKETIIDEIKKLEVVREKLINDLNTERKLGIETVTDLLTYFAGLEIEKQNSHLRKYNSLLIDIIEKIQAQNKKNQLFINKAILSLRNMREDLAGNKKFSTYTPNGQEQRRGIDERG